MDEAPDVDGLPPHSDGAMYIFPRENNAENKPMVRLYTQVNIIGGEKSKLPAQEMRWKVTAEDICNADKRVSSRTCHTSLFFLIFI
jgi:hypothetical protein